MGERNLAHASLFRAAYWLTLIMAPAHFLRSSVRVAAGVRAT